MRSCEAGSLEKPLHVEAFLRVEHPDPHFVILMILAEVDSATAELELPDEHVGAERVVVEAFYLDDACLELLEAACRVRLCGVRGRLHLPWV